MSFVVALATTALATTLGTLAALGLSRARFPARASVMALLISPMIVPVIIASVGMFKFYSQIGVAGSTLGIILAHTRWPRPSS